MEDLALEVRLVDDIHVDDPDRADTGGGEVESGGGTESACTQAQHLGVEQLQLSFLTDLGEEQVTLVAVALSRVEGLWGLPVATFVLPAVEAAFHRDHLGVVERLEGLRRERGADAARAHCHDPGVLRRDPVLDVALELAARDVDRAGDRALFVLVGLTHVEERPPFGEESLGLAGGDLGDRLLRLVQQVAEACHWASFDSVR